MPATSDPALSSGGSPPRPRNIQLDILRGVAILLVIGRHVELEDPPGVVGALSWIWFRIGWLGVDLFFVLSGFLIGGLLLTEIDRYGRLNIRRFLVRRGLKLYPSYFLFILALMLVPVIKTLVSRGDAFARLNDQFHAYWPNLLFLHTYVGQSPAGHTWSLAVEEHFYLLLPFALAALLALGRVRWIIRAAVAAVPICLLLRVIAIWTDNRYAFGMTATHLRIDALLFGVAVRATAQYRPQLFASARRVRLPLLVVGIALWMPNLFIEPDTAVVRTVGLTGTFVGSAAFLLATYHTRAADFGRLAPSTRRMGTLLAGVGVYSYAIYLWHVTVIGITKDRIITRVVSVTGTWNWVAWIITVSVATATSIAVALVATKVVEWPVLRFRDRLFPSRAASLPSAMPENP